MKIEKGIPQPKQRKIRTHLDVYNFADLIKDMTEIGDSVAFPYIDAHAAAGVRGAMGAAARYYKKKITSRKLIEDGELVLRIWRIE